VDGLVFVANFSPDEETPPEVVAAVEKALDYGATAVLFRKDATAHKPAPEAFVYVSNGPVDDPAFGEVHRRLWSWGGVPIVYRKTRGLIQLFRCAHKADFLGKDGEIVCKPHSTLDLATQITSALSEDPWWDASRLRNGTLWDDPAAREELLYTKEHAHLGLIEDIRGLYEALDGALPPPVLRRVLVLSLLIAYLEARKVLLPRFFGCFRKGARSFFQVLGHGSALIALLAALEEKFNGNVFCLSEEEKTTLRGSKRLADFANLVESRTEKNGQITLWRKYSFGDLPVELISHIYQLFVEDKDSSVYTPPFLVRLLLEEALDRSRLDRLEENGEILLDPCCGSGVFLVEAYKRLILHWRSKNGWRAPVPDELRALLRRVRGVDIEQGAIELTAFSLCLVLCDALDVKTIRRSRKLFPPLIGTTLLRKCFFEAAGSDLLQERVGVVVGNPPFRSELRTEGARASYERYQEQNGALPDLQVAYLFLHESACLLQPGGMLCLLQQYNFLYNLKSRSFRRTFFERWDIREILDFISIRGLFSGADTKVVAVLAEAGTASPDRLVLHATFRRTGRVEAKQGFDIDHYDLHWLPRKLAIESADVWRSNLVGGGRVLALVERLRKLPTLGSYATKLPGWTLGEGFIEGQAGVDNPSEHLVGKLHLPTKALGHDGIDETKIEPFLPKGPIEGPRSPENFTPPMLLVHENWKLEHALWTKSYLTYKDQIYGFCAPEAEVGSLEAIDRWFTTEKLALRAFVAATSTKMSTKKSTVLAGEDIRSLPYAESGSLDLSENEQIIVRDIVDHFGDFRLGEKASFMKPLDVAKDPSRLQAFAAVYTRRIGGIYRKKLHPLDVQTWPGIICQPFVFGKGKVDWSGADELREKLAAMLRERLESLHVIRVARIYDGAFVFLLKPNRLRYWLDSVALRDADETLSELREQGF
jgi:hypothetical protein